MAVAVKSWHSTIFAPYFVVGAVHSGVSAVAFVMIILRYIYSWQNYIRHEHIDALGRLLIVVATGWFYFFVMEVIFGFYGREADELAVRDLQFMQNPWNIWMMVFVFTTLLPAGRSLVAEDVPSEPVDNVNCLYISEHRDVAGAFHNHRSGYPEQAGVHLQLV